MFRAPVELRSAGGRAKALSTRAKTGVRTASPYYSESPGRGPVQLHLISPAQLRGVRRTTRTSRDRAEPAAAGCGQRVGARCNVTSRANSALAKI